MCVSESEQLRQGVPLPTYVCVCVSVCFGWVASSSEIKINVVFVVILCACLTQLGSTWPLGGLVR